MDFSYIDEQTFKNIAYTPHPLKKGAYEYCTFIHCNFADSDLSGIRFSETEFIECNFSNAQLSNVSFQDVHFKNCKMLGLRFEACNAIGFSAKFNTCQLDHSSFYQMKLNRTSFMQSQLQSVDFTEAIMKSMMLISCDFLHAHFENTNIEKADFTHSKNYSINPETNTIKGAKFSLPDVVGLLDTYKIRINN